jgi:hypothetical protein
MVRHILIGSALAAVLCAGIPATAAAQPTPPQIVHRIDDGVRRAVTDTDRAVHRAVHHTPRHTRRVTHYNHYTHYRVTHRTVVAHPFVRARCNDGRIHTGRTRFTACAGHGGWRG